MSAALAPEAPLTLAQLCAHPLAGLALLRLHQAAQVAQVAGAAVVPSAFDGLRQLSLLDLPKADLDSLLHLLAGSGEDARAAADLWMAMAAYERMADVHTALGGLVAADFRSGVSADLQRRLRDFLGKSGGAA